MNRLKNNLNMKNSILVFTLSLLMLACGSKDPKAQLEKLRKQKSDLEAQIATLEETLAKSDTSKTEEKSVEVGVMALNNQIFKTYIEVQGRVDADESVSLSSEMPGTINKINVKAGDQVTKGQVLAETDARATQQQLAAYQVSLSLVSQMYEKQKSLWEQKIGTEMQFLQAKTAKEGLESSINAMQEQLRMSKITSPIDGTVDAINIKLGQAVAPGMPAISIVNFSKLKVKADVAESYTARVKNGNEVLIQFPDMMDSVIAKVDYASRAINATSRTFGVEVLLDNRKEYHPNMVAKLKINDYQSPKPLIVVPVKFIQKSSDGSYVLIVENGLAVKRVVTLGREYNGMAEVLNGLNEGDQMITLGYDLVIEGDHVKFTK
jgi:membrane fusion protein (multidrug efflux system)